MHNFLTLSVKELFVCDCKLQKFTQMFLFNPVKGRVSPQTHADLHVIFSYCCSHTHGPVMDQNNLSFLICRFNYNFTPQVLCISVLGRVSGSWCDGDSVHRRGSALSVQHTTGTDHQHTLNQSSYSRLQRFST